MKRFIILLTSFLLTGCFKVDSMDDITIYTSVYPVEYIVSSLYQNHAEIYSIYPDEIIVDEYTLTEKQISDYSESELFIYNGLSDEKLYAAEMINNNRKIKIIDVALGMESENGLEELWLNPSNLLMISQNIKEGFKEYISNPYLKKEIDENYEKIKLNLSELDAKIKLIVENADNKTILVSNDMFKYLEKYGLEVVSLEENDNLTDKVIADAKRMIRDGTIDYIFMKKYEEANSTIQNIIDETGVIVLTVDTISSISTEAREEKHDYFYFMAEYLEQLKKELYQ